MRFGITPPPPRGGPVFNFRSEGRHFVNSNRCLVIAAAFYEFTGTSYPKDQASLYAGRRPLHGDCRHLPGRRWQPTGRVRPADDSAEPGRGTDP